MTKFFDNIDISTFHDEDIEGSIKLAQTYIDMLSAPLNECKEILAVLKAEQIFRKLGISRARETDRD